MTTQVDDRFRAATRLARQWKSWDAESQVYLFSAARADGPIRVLHVTSNTPATGSVEAFGFRPTRDVEFPTHIAEVTPEEFAGIRARTIELPEGWSLDDCQELSTDAAE